jgi:hypothetical protein
MARERKARFIPPADDLKRKALNSHVGFNLTLTAKEARLIERAIEKSADRFANQALIQLRLLRGNIDAADADMRDRPGFLDLARKAALDLKGLGGTFGYQLLSTIAGSLFDYIRERYAANDVQMAVVRLHIDTLYVVMSQRIGGKGGAIEAELVSALRAASRKFA